MIRSKIFHTNEMGEDYSVGCSSKGSLVIGKWDSQLEDEIRIVIPKDKITGFIAGFFQCAYEQDFSWLLLKSKN